MSGTSLDGIDLSIINTDGKDVYKYLKTYYFQYPDNIIKKLNKVINEFDFIEAKSSLMKLSNLITFFFDKKIISLPELKFVDLIGFHGQTIYHNPNIQKSVQLGSPQLLSNILKKLIFDFRSNDLKNNGQGAPLAPIYHKLLIKKLNLELPCCFINIGGISNLTYVDEKI